MGRFESIEERIDGNIYFSEQFKNIFKGMLTGLKKDTTRYDYCLNVSGICSMAGKDFLALDSQDITKYFKEAAKSMAPSSLRSRRNSFKSIARACDESTSMMMEDGTLVANKTSTLVDTCHFAYIYGEKGLLESPVVSEKLTVDSIRFINEINRSWA